MLLGLDRRTRCVTVMRLHLMCVRDHFPLVEFRAIRNLRLAGAYETSLTEANQDGGNGTV